MKSRRPLAPAAWARSTTGRRAFEGTDVTDTLAAVLRSEPDWTVLPANVPPGVQQLVTGCLVKDRRDRIRDLSTALYLFDPKALAAPEPAPVAMPATPPRRPSTATLLIATGNNQGAGFDVLPDGRFLVLRRPDPRALREIVVVQRWFEELRRLAP